MGHSVRRKQLLSNERIAWGWKRQYRDNIYMKTGRNEPILFRWESERYRKREGSEYESSYEFFHFVCIKTSCYHYTHTKSKIGEYTECRRSMLLVYLVMKVITIVYYQKGFCVRLKWVLGIWETLYMLLLSIMFVEIDKIWQRKRRGSHFIIRN